MTPQLHRKKGILFALNTHTDPEREQTSTKQYTRFHAASSTSSNTLSLASRTSLLAMLTSEVLLLLRLSIMGRMGDLSAAVGESG
jgi:hypothetical protein